MEPINRKTLQRIAAALFLTLGPAAPLTADVFDRFDLPDAWEESFWTSPNSKKLLAMEPKTVAALVPVQAGVHFCRCPSCDATEADDTLQWSIESPKSLKCSRCHATFPNDKIPAHEDKKPVPEDVVEVLPEVTHKYPYHDVEAEKQRFPGERLYLAAKADDRAREFFAKAALYAAVKHREQPPGQKDPKLANLAAVIVLRFAQVYRSYATHFDQPRSLKFFQNADLKPPYRSGYRTGKWEATGSRNVPLNLVVAYAILRGDPAIGDAGKALGVENPIRIIEHDLFRGSAEFVRNQPEESNETSLPAYRGILAVGRLLNDAALSKDALSRIDRFAKRGFYHDGLWQAGNLAAHRRVLGQLDAWIDPMLTGDVRNAGVAESSEVPMLALARAADAAVISDAAPVEVRQAGFPPPALNVSPRSPRLLGGAGVARLAAGEGENAFDLELRGLPSFGASPQQRETLRLAVAGKTLLGDLDETNGLPGGFDRASASHNTVIVDGLNQRESIALARTPAPGGNVLFYAADPDFQVVTLDDPRAYPESTTRYRQTIVLSAVGRSRYAVSVFEVEGGLRHDALYHAASGSKATWKLSVATTSQPATLLPPGLTYVPTARADDGRWFVQAYGEFVPRERAEVSAPATAFLNAPGGGVRLHMLGDVPTTLITASSPDPASPSKHEGDDSGRASLIVRHRAKDGSTLSSLFVTLFEPVSGVIPPLTRVGRVASPPGTVVLVIETAEGPEHVVINLARGTARKLTLADGRTLLTDGLAVRANASGLVLAGGTYADVPGFSVRQRQAGGRIVGTFRKSTPGSRGGFESDTPIPDPDALAGRAVLIRHGDGTTHGWTIDRVENSRKGTKIFVREEPGFNLDPNTGDATYYQFPLATPPGPHAFRISRIAR